MPFKYTIDFITQADLAAAEKTEKAVAKVGTEADKTGGKLKDLGTAGEEGGKGLVGSLSDAGDKGGEGLSKGIMQGVLGADAIGKAWELGSMIGDRLGEGMTAAWEAGEGNRADAFWAAIGSGDAQARIAAEEYAQAMSATIKKLNTAIAEDYRKFWAEYNNTLPQNAGDWLVEIGEKADAVKAKMQGLAEVQSAMLKMTRTKIEQDHLDRKDQIEQDPKLSKSQKLSEHASNDAVKARKEASLREQERVNKAKDLGAGVASKEAEVAALEQAEAKQKERELAERHAKKAADEAIATAEQGGEKATDENKTFFTKKAYEDVSKKSGIEVTPDQDENAQLLKTKAELDKSRAELAKMKEEATQKKRVLAVEQMADDEATNRTAARTRRVGGREVEKQRQEEQADTDLKNRPAVPNPPNDNEQTSPDDPNVVKMQEQLTQAAQTTGNAAQKMDLEELKRALSDGGSVSELKQATALIQQMQTSSNGALRSLAEALKQSVEKTAANNQSIRGDMEGLKAQIEALNRRF